ncbi:hypothetical protein Aple_043290 [Acrocarpospora pleiomorpha]|uniref:Uncharacterized protein n=1 Tax=Acrocarpospora pleiomorpha TaxID=90975 RepID=A0A5M3XQI8_9ACTN|nr:hypothetical protein [Acrocarpospora pleiomorpha]GES21433.1 hypothetical protein Aple_043290 [Acrocarpospora pleiomorpha]
MRFIKKFAVSAVAAAALIGGALLSPASANAAVPYFDGPWGPYFSSDHKAEASGFVSVEKHKTKKWYWDKKKVLVKECYWKHGEKKCDWKYVWKKFKAWKWVDEYKFTVKGELINHAWDTHHKKYRCAWATFKIEPFSGPTYFKKFKNCGEDPKHFWFSGKNAEHISVKVSRGDHWGPKGFFGPWGTVYDHV